jgi:hypothetical protein
VKQPVLASGETDNQRGERQDGGDTLERVHDELSGATKWDTIRPKRAGWSM